jgi:hypothetical protein
MMKRRAEGNTRIPSMSMSWVTLAIIAVIGIFSLLSIFMGLEMMNSSESGNFLYYMVIGLAGFAAIGYMLFSTKNAKPKKMDVPQVDIVTIMECPSCNLKRVRDFKRGDYVRKDDEGCTRCEGNMVIIGIHKRADPKKKVKPS